MSGATMTSVSLLWVLAGCLGAVAALPFHAPLWSTDVLPSQSPSMAVNDDTLFVVVNTSLTAVRAVDGVQLWTADVPQVPVYGYYYAPVLGANSRWVVASTTSNTFLYDAQTGAMVSTCGNCSAVNSATAVVPTQREDTFAVVLFNGQNLALLRVSSTHNELSHVWSSTGVMLSYAIATGTSKICFLADSNDSLGDAFLYILDAAHPHVPLVAVQTVSGVAAMATTPVNGFVATISGFGVVSLVDLTTATVVWNNTNVSNALFPAVQQQQVLMWQTAATVAVTGSTPGFPLFVLDAASGWLVANQTFAYGLGWPYNVLAGPVLAAGRWVLLATDATDANTQEPRLVALDPTDGSVLSSGGIPSLEAPVVAAVGNARVVVPNAQGFVMLDARNTSLPLSYNLYSCPGAVGVTPFVDKALFVVFNGGTLVGFDTAIPQA